MSDTPAPIVRPFEDLLDPTGLLWLINTSVFHPRGYALVIDRDEATGHATGWYLMGDGKERWSYAEDGIAVGMLDARFQAVRRTLP